MKHLYVLTFVLGSLVFTGCASTSQSVAASEPPPRLQVSVGVPPTMSILYEEEIAEAFGYRVVSSLREQGFRGRIRYVERWEKPSPDAPLLAIELREWRVDRVGAVDCTFTADVIAGDTRRPLGVFSGTSLMMWSRRDWYARERGFEEAARDAITNLRQRLEDTGLIDAVRR